MAPSKVRRQTLSQLGRTFRAMMTPQWDLALEGRSDEEVTEAARSLLAVQRARLRLANAELADIRDGLQANEAALLKGAAELDGALADLRDVRRVLEATAAVLRAVGRVVDVVV